MLNRLPDQISGSTEPGLSDIPATIQWLVSRQQNYEENEDEEELSPAGIKMSIQGVYDEDPPKEDQFVGMNGRCNKRVDTCYAFWVTASLDVYFVTSAIIKRIIVDSAASPRYEW